MGGDRISKRLVDRLNALPRRCGARGRRLDLRAAAATCVAAFAPLERAAPPQHRRARQPRRATARPAAAEDSCARALQGHGLQWAEGRRVTLGRLRACRARRPSTPARIARDLASGARKTPSPYRRHAAHRHHAQPGHDGWYCRPRFRGIDARRPHARRPDQPAAADPAWCSATRTRRRRAAQGLYDTAAKGACSSRRAPAMSKLPLRLRMPPTIDVLTL